MSEYRITFVIERADSEGDEFVEVGFGSSSAWGDIDSALHDIDSAIGNRQWETEGDMPDPEGADEQEARPDYCCGKCPPIVGGGYDCTCKGNPRCAKEAPDA